MLKCAIAVYMYVYMMYAQKTNTMGAQVMNRGPIIWGHNACTEDQSYGDTNVCTEDQTYSVYAEDQSYGDTMYAQWTNPIGTMYAQRFGMRYMSVQRTNLIRTLDPAHSYMYFYMYA